MSNLNATPSASSLADRASSNPLLIACTDAALAKQLQNLPRLHVIDAHSFFARYFERLTASGFAQVGEGDDLVLRKTMRVWDMPYAREHMVDGVHIFDNDQAVIEVGLDGFVNFSIGDGRYDEDAVSGETPEGLGVLMDAGLVSDPCHRL